MHDPIQVHTLDSAPAAARETLAQVQAKLGFVPNLLGVLANAPALLDGYVALSSVFDTTSLTPTERQVVLLAVSFENRCEYCMAAHTVSAEMQRVPGDVVLALREGERLADAKLEALRRFTVSTVRTRGWPAQDVVREFGAAGYGRQQALEVVLGVGVKTLSNYANHLANTPLDEAFARAAWNATGRGDGARG